MDPNNVHYDRDSVQDGYDKGFEDGYRAAMRKVEAYAKEQDNATIAPARVNQW